MKHFRLFAVVVLIGLSILALKETVLACNPGGGRCEATNGDYFNGSVQYYFHMRYVDDPDLPGPEVAFYLTNSAPLGIVMLGSTQCGYSYDGPIYTQYYDSVEPVAYFSSERSFCVVSYGNGSGGSFYGNIYWDEDPA